MARLPRNVLAEGRFFHVTARGVAREAVFRDREDRLEFLGLLATAVRRHDWQTHAYCLMGNHLHLVVEAGLAQLSRGMHLLLGAYAQRFNERHGRVGHLFGDRFAARLIASEEYLATACGYVLLNPVRAGLCETAGEWPWSASRYSIVPVSSARERLVRG